MMGRVPVERQAALPPSGPPRQYRRRDRRAGVLVHKGEGTMILARLPENYPVSRAAWIAFMDAPETSVLAYCERLDADALTKTRAGVMTAQLRVVLTTDGVPWPARHLRALPGGVHIPFVAGAPATSPRAGSDASLTAVDDAPLTARQGASERPLERPALAPAPPIRR